MGGRRCGFACAATLTAGALATGALVTRILAGVCAIRILRRDVTALSAVSRSNGSAALPLSAMLGRNISGMGGTTASTGTNGAASATLIFAALALALASATATGASAASDSGARQKPAERISGVETTMTASIRPVAIARDKRIVPGFSGVKPG